MENTGWIQNKTKQIPNIDRLVLSRWPSWANYNTSWHVSNSSKLLSKLSQTAGSQYIPNSCNGQNRQKLKEAKQS